MRSREKERRRRREHEEKMEGRVVIRSDSFACDDHCSVRLMKTHEHRRRSHLPSPSGRSSRTSSSHRPISATEKARVVNLEFIKAIVTAEEVLLLDPLCQEVLLFVDQLRQQLPHKSVSKSQGGGQMDLQDKEMQL